MQAPVPNPVVLSVERTRCTCHVETLVFSPAAWYPRQRSVEIEPVCAGCGRSLLEQTVPEGARWEAYALEAVPDGLARAIGTELVDEVVEARKKAGTAAPAGSGAVLDVSRWTTPHEAPPEYAEWLAKQPAPPGWVTPEELREWGTATAVVVFIVIVCLIL